VVLGSSVPSAYESVIPGNWRSETHRINSTRKRLFLPRVDNRNTIRHEVENHGVTEVIKNQPHGHS
jgi:hypothetical protein